MTSPGEASSLSVLVLPLERSACWSLEAGLREHETPSESGIVGRWYSCVRIRAECSGLIRVAVEVKSFLRCASLNSKSVDLKATTYAIGQAVFLRTDTVDYSEVLVPFQTLEEMVQICSVTRANQILDKVVVFSMADGGPCALTLGFISASQGQRASPGEVRV